jgi:hypothetical protein
MSEDELDAYSRTVSAVAKLLTPHVASVSLRRGTGSPTITIGRMAMAPTLGHVRGRKDRATLPDMAGRHSG